MLPTDVINGVIDGVMAHFGFPEISRSFFEEQARCENCDAENNPLACTQTMPNSTVFNVKSVQNYPTLEEGIQATIWTLDPTSYGGIDYYPKTRQALRQGLITSDIRADIVREIGSSWGTSDFAEEIKNGWQMSAEPPFVTVAAGPTNEPIAPVPTLEARVSALEKGLADLNAAVLKRFAFIASTLHIAADPNNIPE